VVICETPLTENEARAQKDAAALAAPIVDLLDAKAVAKAFRTQDEQRALIEAEVATFPATFRLNSFPDVQMRLGDMASHFFTDHSETGEMQLVLQALQPDGNWLDFGRNTPAYIKALMMVEAKPKAKRVRKAKEVVA
jgi:hypothetical protein